MYSLMITPFICARPQRAQNGTFCFIGREACTGAFVAARGRQGPGARRRPHWHTGPGRGGGAGPNSSPNGYAPTGISRAWISCPVIVYMHYGCDIMHS